jgi:TatD DNase family protein
MAKKKQRPSPATLGLPPGGVDTHVHVDMRHLAEDLPGVLERAAEAGVSCMGNVFLGHANYIRNKVLFEGRDEVFFMLGVHPHEAVEVNDAELAAIEAAFREDDRLKALGEVGLDYYYDTSPREVQRAAFREQLALAEDLDVPLVLHCRDAEEDAFAILDDMGFADRPLLWHCFGKDRAIAEEILKRGWTISIPGPVTYRKNEALREAAAMIPLESLVLETDCPFLSPEPWRGKPNEPAYLAFTAVEVARIKNMPPEDIWAATADTAKAFFQIA